MTRKPGTPASDAPGERTHPRVLARLAEQIAVTHHPVDLACLQGQQALMLARLGRHDDAASITRALHQRFDAQPDPRVSVWLALAEGLDAYYRDLDLAGRDRLRRAHALAQAARLRPLQALAAAWLAQLDYVRHDLPALGRHLADALSGAPGDDHAVLARAALVMAQGLHWAGRLDAAMPWYSSARAHAQADGDDATLAALMHNAAWLRAMHARAACLWPEAAPGTPRGSDADLALPIATSATATDTAQARAMAGSAANLDRLIDNRAMTQSLPVLQALLAVDRGDALAAMAAFEALDALPGSDAGTMANGRRLGGRWDAMIEADRAWCLVLQGKSSLAHDAVVRALAAMERQPDVDDRALTHARLAAVLARLGDAAAADHHARLAALDRADADAARAAMAALLEPLDRVYRP
jgi:hypothetical protein